ncbi:MAG: Mut7-C RNAse domain-containing protein [Dehalococcoidaceae bacterium]|nr:Mut7-C RNAse domain-containing protein [Dehalococcoidaceae bacterium]
MVQTEAPKFVVDANAGKLVGWLRLMGYDTRFFSAGPDRELIRTALEDRRILLTRDTLLAERKLVKNGTVGTVILTSDAAEEQIKQVFAELGLKPDFAPFSRCLACNGKLEPVEAATVKGLVPPYVFKTRSIFSRCPDCERIYWQGTHWEAMNARLRQWSRLAEK